MSVLTEVRARVGLEQNERRELARKIVDKAEQNWETQDAYALTPVVHNMFKNLGFKSNGVVSSKYRKFNIISVTWFTYKLDAIDTCIALAERKKLLGKIRDSVDNDRCLYFFGSKSECTEQMYQMLISASDAKIETLKGIFK